MDGPSSDGVHANFFVQRRRFRRFQKLHPGKRRLCLFRGAVDAGREHNGTESRPAAARDIEFPAPAESPESAESRCPHHRAVVTGVLHMQRYKSVLREVPAEVGITQGRAAETVREHDHRQFCGGGRRIWRGGRQVDANRQAALALGVEPFEVAQCYARGLCGGCRSRRCLGCADWLNTGRCGSRAGSRARRCNRLRN